MEIQDSFKYPNDLDYLQEDSHGYSIIDLNNIDNIDEDMI